MGDKKIFLTLEGAMSSSKLWINGTLAKERMGGELHKLCAREIPGDTHRNLAIQPEFSRQTFKHILLPAWLASFRFRKKVYQVLINGCTGEVAGFYPKSWWKIVLAVLGAGAAVALVVLLLNA